MDICKKKFHSLNKFNNKISLFSKLDDTVIDMSSEPFQSNPTFPNSGSMYTSSSSSCANSQYSHRTAESFTNQQNAVPVQSSSGSNTSPNGACSQFSSETDQSSGNQQYAQPFQSSNNSFTATTGSYQGATNQYPHPGTAQRVDNRCGQIVQSSSTSNSGVPFQGTSNRYPPLGQAQIIDQYQTQPVQSSSNSHTSNSNGHFHGTINQYGDAESIDNQQHNQYVQSSVNNFTSSGNPPTTQSINNQPVQSASSSNSSSYRRSSSTPVENSELSTNTQPPSYQDVTRRQDSGNSPRRDGDVVPVQCEDSLQKEIDRMELGGY